LGASKGGAWGPIRVRQILYAPDIDIAAELVTGVERPSTLALAALFALKAQLSGDLRPGLRDVLGPVTALELSLNAVRDLGRAAETAVISLSVSLASSQASSTPAGLHRSDRHCRVHAE
jgi:hypothetical protein